MSPFRPSSSVLVHRPRIPMMVGLAAMIMSLCAALLTPAPAAAAATVRTFESDAVGAVPAGCSTPAGKTAAVVSTASAYQSQRALRIADTTTSSQTVVVCPASGQAGADLRFMIRPASLANGVLVSFLGSFQGKPQTGVPVFHLQVKPDGSLHWFDGLTQASLGWTQLAPTGTVPQGAWTQLTLQVPTNHRETRIYKGTPSTATYVGALGPVGVSPVAAISGFQFASFGTATSGDDVFVDNVSIDNGSAVLPAPDHPDFDIGTPKIIDYTDGGFMQMPNTATLVPRSGGQPEVLVGYPVHGDATHDTGTAIASSLDGGQTWSNADSRNPFPNEQSFYLSTLRNGNLLAVNYHTFMTPNTNNTKAEVPTALSSDGGRTWTYRGGTMTAPQSMRSISDATSRPGFPLGGFVLVHRVVEDADGTLYQSGYGYYANDTKFRQIIMVSTDRGVNWTVRATVAVNPNLSTHPRYEGFCEGAIVRTSDGALLTIMRTGNYQSLYASRSTNNGQTWSTPQPISVAGVPVVGVFPDLVLMGNGTLVLYVGRPGQSVLASPDGTGNAWSKPAMVDYLNSGNGVQLPIGPDKLLTFGDRGADWTPNTPTRKAIWVTPVTVE